MKALKILSVPFAAAIIMASCSQRYVMKGDEAYDNLAYSEAIDNYEKVKEKKMDYQTMVRLADSYHFNNQPKEAAHWYGEAMDEKPIADVSDQTILRYAQTLESTKEYDEAEEYYKLYLNRNPYDDAALSRTIATNLNEDGLYKDDRFDLEKVSINQKNASAMCPVFYNNGLVFTAERDKSGDNNESPWTGRPFVETYYAEMKPDGSLKSPRVFAENVQSPYDDGAVSFSPDGNVMYFTRTNIVDGELKTDDQNEVNLQLFRTHKQADGSWGDPIRLSINSNEFNSVHPAVSKDGKRLYFASDRPGTVGGADIYVASINPDGSVTNERNLGYLVNTERNELFPTVTTDQGRDVLCFSSEGHAGYGGLDIFRTTAYGSYWTLPQPFSTPINSPRDDFGLVMKDNMSEGYLTSTRDSEDGIDAIYHFTKTNEATLQVNVLESDDLEEVNNAQVAVVSDDEVILKETSRDGEAHIVLEADEDYKVTVTKDGYERESMMVVTADELYGDTVQRSIVLDEELNLNDVKFQPIYFDFDEAQIRDNEKKDLNKVAAFLQDNPEVSVKLIGHTDSRGSEDYNEELSEERAEATKNYLMKKGIPEERIHVLAYGEDHLVIECDDPQKDCSENEYQKNRRTVIQFVELDVYSNSMSDL